MIYLADAVLNIRTVSKELKLTGKEVTEKLAEYGHEIKSATAEITPQQASLVLDIFTLKNETEKGELSAIFKKAVDEAAKAAEDKNKTPSRATKP